MHSKAEYHVRLADLLQDIRRTLMLDTARNESTKDINVLTAVEEVQLPHPARHGHHRSLSSSHCYRPWRGPLLPVRVQAEARISVHITPIRPLKPLQCLLPCWGCFVVSRRHDVSLELWRSTSSDMAAIKMASSVLSAVPLGDGLAVKDDLSLDAAMVTLRKLDARDKATKVRHPRFTATLVGSSDLSVTDSAAERMKPAAQSQKSHLLSMRFPARLPAPAGL